MDKVIVSDDAWKYLQTIYPLCDEMRGRIASIIDLYNRFEAGRRVGARPSEVRKQLIEAAQVARELNNKLQAFSSEALIAITENSQAMSATPRMEAIRTVSDRIADVEHLASWLDRTAQSIQDGSRDASNNRWLVKQIAELIWICKQERITRSQNHRFVDYFKAIGRLCSPQIGGGSIDEAMKSVIETSGETVAENDGSFPGE